MADNENTFPTIRDFAARLADLTQEGFGDLPAQILVVPDSTLQAIARVKMADGYNATKPALMIDLQGDDSQVLVGLISTERMKSAATQ